jgi:hypothetical protein
MSQRRRRSISILGFLVSERDPLEMESQQFRRGDVKARTPLRLEKLSNRGICSMSWLTNTGQKKKKITMMLAVVDGEPCVAL